ncbi:MAG TPA: class I adenylate-forming enzyme family protein, partial [Blastocatellia bacterium]|nr:class I adenylate-forming enzyme family protein [Blastocatellia bacterium]
MKTETMRENLVSFLDDWARRGSEPAIAHRRGLRVVRWSYSELRATAFQFARELDGRGIEKGDRVLFWARNSPEWVAGFFGCLLRGVVVVPLDLESTPEFVARIQQQVAAKLILGGREHLRFAPNVPAVVLEDLPQIVAR